MVVEISQFIQNQNHPIRMSHIRYNNGSCASSLYSPASHLNSLKSHDKCTFNYPMIIRRLLLPSILCLEEMILFIHKSFSSSSALTQTMKGHLLIPMTICLCEHAKFEIMRRDNLSEMKLNWHMRNHVFFSVIILTFQSVTIPRCLRIIKIFPQFCLRRIKNIISELLKSDWPYCQKMVLYFSLEPLESYAVVFFWLVNPLSYLALMFRQWAHEMFYLFLMNNQNN